MLKVSIMVRCDTGTICRKANILIEKIQRNMLCVLQKSSTDNGR